MAAYGGGEVQVVHIPAVQILNDRGVFSASLGVIPPPLRPLAKKLPWFSKGSKAVKDLAGIAIAAVAKRLATPSDRVDLLAKLQQGRDDEGNPMGREELTAEALTQLIAGSDTTSKYVLNFVFDSSQVELSTNELLSQFVMRHYVSPCTQPPCTSEVAQGTRRSTGQ